MGQFTPSASVYQQHLETAYANVFSAERFRELLWRLLSVQHLPFSLVAATQFQDLLKYASPHLRGNDVLITSGTTAKTSTVELFLAYQVMLIAFLLESPGLIHLSFDLWTAPNKFHMLGVVCHFIDKNFKTRTILLGMKRLFGPKSGENQAELVIEVIKKYKLENRMGYCMMDNASDNDTAMVAISKYLATKNVIWSAEEHRLRCFGHVISLVAQAFVENRPLKVPKPHAPKDQPKEPKAPKAAKVRTPDAISKLHAIVFFIMWTGKRILDFIRMNKTTEDDMLLPVKENDTRWFSTYLMLKRALKLKDSLDLFVFRFRPVTKDEKDIRESTMDADDWAYIVDFITFFEELYFLCIGLEGKEDSGMHIYPLLFRISRILIFYYREYR
jgi:hypothetical protein